MKLHTIGSGSSGNCHYLEDSYGNILLLDLGLPIKEIKAGIKFRVSNVVGALVTHEHSDHAKSAKDFEKMGIPVFMPYADTKPKQLREPIPFTPKFDVTVIPMTDSNHHFVHTNGDGTECPCYGYMIKHEEMGIFVYITDCEFIKWRFKEIDHVLLGIDYDDGREYDTSDAKIRHTMTGHMGLSTGKEFIRVTSANNYLQNVIMCHLSEENAEAEDFIREMSEVANYAVYVAKKGTVVDLARKD